MPTDEATEGELCGCLREAVAMTKKVMSGAITPDAVRDLLAARAPLLARATAAKQSGTEWGAVEAELAQQVIQMDRALVDALWKPRRDAFGWLAARSEDVERAMPAIAALSRRAMT